MYHMPACGFTHFLPPLSCLPTSLKSWRSVTSGFQTPPCPFASAALCTKITYVLNIITIYGRPTFMQSSHWNRCQTVQTSKGSCVGKKKKKKYSLSSAPHSHLCLFCFAVSPFLVWLDAASAICGGPCQVRFLLINLQGYVPKYARNGHRMYLYAQLPLSVNTPFAPAVSVQTIFSRSHPFLAFISSLNRCLKGGETYHSWCAGTGNIHPDTYLAIISSAHSFVRTILALKLKLALIGVRVRVSVI